MAIAEILAKEGIIDKGDLQALARAVAESGGDEEKVLLRAGIKFEDIVRAKAGLASIPARALGATDVPLDVLRLVPEDSALYYKIVPISIAEGVLEIGIVNPDNIEARDAAQFAASKAGMPLRLFTLSEADFNRVFGSYKGLSGEVSEALTELESELSSEEQKLSKALHDEAPESAQMEAKVIEDAPVTKIVATVLHYAVEGDASDIHIEPMDDRVRVRFRVDGVLNTSLYLPLKVHTAVVARIKILSNIRLDEKRKPQDGRFSARIEGRKIDFRVSTFPSYYGEKVVMRILDAAKGVKKLDNLGLSERNLKLVREALKKPYGLLLISGPTGSGKTTTLYSMLNEIDRDKRNVLSLEDPVEYNIPGMNQSQVRPEIGYTFANGLRTTLRQDPDIIMVGEIRDKETAQLAVQAALTGHLVLSTIHTNNAVGVIPRLIDMGVDPFLIAPTLILAIAQRLVQTLCPGAGKPVEIDGAVKVLIEKEFVGASPEIREKVFSPGRKVHEATGTSDCPRGTRGRMAVYEVLSMDKDLERVLLKDPSEPEVLKVARAQGMLTMREDAIIKSIQQLVPFEEAYKV